MYSFSYNKYNLGISSATHLSLMAYFVSSANLHVTIPSLSWRSKYKDTVYKMNRIGDKGEPWGTLGLDVGWLCALAVEV